ncbi:MAG: hypothetical protein ACOY90_19955 [Candidatus Zhuqueibacterota bacterium]
MRIFYIFISIIGLALTLLPSVLVFFGKIQFEYHRTLMLVGTLLWFIAAPLWMKRETNNV